MVNREMAEKADSIDRIGVLPDVYRNVPEYVPYSINKINRQTANKHGTLSRAGAERAVPGFFLPSFPVMRPGVCVWCFDGFAAAALDLAERKLLSDGRINQAGEREREREREDNGELISRWARSSLATAASNRTARLPLTVSRWPSDIWSSPTSNKNERCHLLAATHKNDTNSFLNPSKLGDVAHTHTHKESPTRPSY